MASEAIQGHECGAYVALGRFSVTEQGMAYGARALRLRSPNSSRGRNAPPGRTGEPSTGRSGTGDSIRSNPEVREMRTAETVLSIIRDRGQRAMGLRSQTGVTGEPRDTETVMRGSEEGCWKSTSQGQLAGSLSYGPAGSEGGVWKRP
jgi:hypothetical protein